jgi:uncharacterized membrane-anchored protein YitT (DUF2179 family)
MTNDLKTQFKEIKERERSVGLFLLAILFGLIVGVGGNAFYDLFIKPNIFMQILAVFVTGIVVIFVIKEVRYAQKRMNEMEEKLKKLERG